MRYLLPNLGPKDRVMLVGCGGTGGFVAEGLCRLLGPEHKLYLVDNDRVEKRNLGRQNFTAADLGRFKSQALAERLSSQYNREVGWCVSDITELGVDYRSDLTIGCVDNPEAREKLQYAGFEGMGNRHYGYCHSNGWYIDAGNGEHSGQVLIGNALTRELRYAFIPESGVCRYLPLPQIQQPALLSAEMAKKKPRRNCAEAVERDEQSPVINQMMASVVLAFVHKLMQGTLGWMGAYVDLESGTMSPVDATPEIVARMTGLTVRQLEFHPRKAK